MVSSKLTVPRFLIVGHRQSIRIYSGATSLLYRAIDLSINASRGANVRIVAYALSQTNSNMIWVGCSDGAVYNIDWTTGAGTDQFWTTSSMGMIHMTATAMTFGGQKRDVVFTTEARRDGGWRITAHQLTPPGSETPSVAKTIYTSTQPIHILKAAKSGGVVVAASENRVLMGNVRGEGFESVEKMKYEFFVFESTDYISTIDVRVTERAKTAKNQKNSKGEKFGVVDVVVGDVKGSIFVHNDLLRKVSNAQHKEGPAVSLTPRKLHWHRKTVETVKWSLDGNYIISGGSETVMVIWQLDTGNKQFLPHMSATIKNIVVSPSGGSYAVRLADNSAIVLSTAELTPITSISGIQAQVIRDTASMDARVSRVQEEERDDVLVQRTPAVVNPTDPTRLLLAVGENQEIDPLSKQILHTPYLQTFNLANSHNISRQALSRTNVTNINVAPSAHKLSEPQITHMQISGDGSWLATVDEWLPPRKDLEALGYSADNLPAEQRKRREVYLKFWEWSQTNQVWELVSRIDAPHTLYPENTGAGRVLDLKADASSHTFSTIGEDNTVRIWRPKVRTRDGVIVRGQDNQALCNWTCQGTVVLPKAVAEDDTVATSQRPEHGVVAFSEDGSVLAAALAGSEDAVVHLIDPLVGTLKYSRPSSYAGDIVSMAILRQYLIIVSDELRVYDIVSNELQYGIELGKAQLRFSLQQKVEMTHLAIDAPGKTFAIALPIPTQSSLVGIHSQIAIFDPTRAALLSARTLPHLITALIPSIHTQGYLTIDSTAEICTYTPKAAQAKELNAHSMADLGISVKMAVDSEEPAPGLMELVEEAQAEDTEMEDADEMMIDAEELEEGDGAPVVSQQQLTNVFDIGPAFALPPIEEMFYQVSGLFSVKPVNA